MKKLVKNITFNFSHTLRTLSLFVVLFGVIGFLFSCAPATTAAPAAATPLLSSFSANDVLVTFGGEIQGSVRIESAVDETSNPTLVISGLTNADNVDNVTGMIMITARPTDFTTSTPRLDFNDAEGFKTTNTLLTETLTVTNLSTGEGLEVTYDIDIEFTGAPVAAVAEKFLTATLGEQTGVISVSGTTLTIELLNPRGITPGGMLEVSNIPNGYTYSPNPYVFMDPDGTDAVGVINDERFTLSEVDGEGNVVKGNTVTYTVIVNYSVAPGSLDFSADDVFVIFDRERQGSARIEPAVDEANNPTLVISGLTNADNVDNVTGIIIIAERPADFVYSTSIINFNDAEGFKTTNTLLTETLTVTNLSTGEDIEVTYDIDIEFTGAPVAALAEKFLTATLGEQTGMVSVSDTTLTIELLNSGGVTPGGMLEASNLLDGYVYSPMPYTFSDPAGTNAEMVVNDAQFTLSEVDGNGDLVNGNTMAYTVIINYSAAPSPLLSQDITATFGGSRGVVQIRGTDVIISGLRNPHDSAMFNGLPLEFNISIADQAPVEFTVTTPLAPITLINGLGDLSGTGATNIDLGTFTITSDSTPVSHTVTVQFGAALELRVSEAVNLLSTTENYVSVLEGAAMTDIRGPGCPDTYVPPTFEVYQGSSPTTYRTSGFPDTLSPYVDRTSPANNTNAVVLSVLNGSDVVTTFNFNYIVSCQASDLTGDGDSTSPYEVFSASALDLVSYLVERSAAFRSNHYVLTTNIDLGVAGAPWTEGEVDNPGAGFNPMGTRDLVDAGFYGSFSCADYTISNLFINRPATDDIGLIGFLDSGASVSNCRLVDVDITGKDNVGGLVGYSEGIIAENSITGAVEGDMYVGGLVGRHSNYRAIADCIVGASVTGFSIVGGLVGHLDSPLRDSFTTGDVTSSSSFVGGLVGVLTNNRVISGSYATGDVTGYSSVGGLVGLQFSGRITTSYATGDVEGSRIVGGLVGNAEGTIETSYATGNVTSTEDNTGGLVGTSDDITIRSSYATGNVTGTRANTGGLVGKGTNITIHSSYSTGDVTGATNLGGLIGYIEEGTIANVYVRGTISIESGTQGSKVGGGIGSVYGQYPVNLTNSYTVVAGGDYSFVGDIDRDLDVTNSYAGGTSSNSAPAPSAIDGLSQEALADLKTPEAAGTAATDLYFDWDTDVWDFGTAMQLPVLKTTPGGAAAQTARD